MMRVIGIIAEYNPLHEGHIYHMERSRELLGGDAPVVVVMSGHAVQRGDFPVMTKYARARAAALSGADLVIELPSPWSCACAERFATAGVGILTRLGVVTHLSFGSESGELEPLERLAGRIASNYPKDISLARAMPGINPGYGELYTPNNILGIEYLRAIRALGSPLIPITVKRRGSLHDDGVASASAYRRGLLNGAAVKLPQQEVLANELEAGRAPIDFNRLETAVLSKLRTMGREELAMLPEMRGGFHNRLHGAIAGAGSLEELYSLVKSKRFTLSRVRRAVLCAFLGITEDMALATPPLRLLAIGKRGPELLSRVSATVISRPAAGREALSFESSVTDQLCLAMPKPRPCGMEWTCGVEVI